MSTWTTEDRIAAEELGSKMQKIAQMLIEKHDLEKENAELKERIKHLESQVYGGTTK